MDRPDADPGRVRESLDDLRRVNRILGGFAALAHGLRRALGEEHGVRRVLDVGTGAADVPEWIVRRAAARGRPARAVGLDRGRAAIGVARAAMQGNRAVRLVRGDALALPFRDGAFDIAVSSTTLHHFSGGAAVRFLTEMHRVARRGVVIGDLRRSVPAYLAVKLLAATLWRRHAYARHDGPASVRRAYTVGELRALLAAAHLPGRVERRRFFRVSVWIPKGDAHAETG
jgi:SAM-dependent methyltransferase